MNQKQNEKMKLKLLSEIKTDLERISTLKLKRIQNALNLPYMNFDIDK